jgi:hypothetical protein
MELTVGQRYKRLEVVVEGELQTLRNVMVFDAVTTDKGPGYILGVTATPCPAAWIMDAEAVEDGS